MIRIIDIRSLVLLAGLTVFGAPNLMACTQNTTDDTETQDDELRPSESVEVSQNNGNGSARLNGVPATVAHPTTRLGPHPDPWVPGDDNGPHPDPWSGRSGDGSNTGTGTGTGTGTTPKPGDPSNPNQ